MFIADLHIHSPWSRATSKKSTLAGLFAWARVKGINLVASGDFTHPAWRAHLNDHLAAAEPGLYRLKDENPPPALGGIIPAAADIRFLLSSEISSIYKKDGRVRKIHNLIYVPTLADAAAISARLAAIGNIESDGRPILGLDARDLLEIVLEESEHGFMVPAHIWTPWFSLFGSKSGFDHLEDCFGDLSEHIFALETGLSSDPEMNRLVSGLDRYTLISNSDCHSPAKLGREANIFSCPLDFFAIREALIDPGKGLEATVEFFPEEGKYHLDGHRKCGVSLDPADSAKLNNTCPVCGRPLTIGVLARVMELADRGQPIYPADSPAVHSLIPLPEVLGEIMSCGPATIKVAQLYSRLIAKFGSEFNILINTPVEELQKVSPLLAEAMIRMRSGKVIRHGGFDGEFGVIRVFEEGERQALTGQSFMFGVTVPKKKKKRTRPPAPPSSTSVDMDPAPDFSTVSNPAQDEAVGSDSARIMVIAGPGTGKTHTLTGRIMRLIEKGRKPESIWAITFTNRAADEIKTRLDEHAGGVFTGTFHAFCLYWLKKKDPGLRVISPDDAISAGDNTIELDRIIPMFIKDLAGDQDLEREIRERVEHILIDEFQDVNPEQAMLVEEMARSAAVFVIGDPNQAIYGFRGAEVENFFAFMNNPATRVIRLKNNYRSRPEILAAAQELVADNRQGGDLELTPLWPAGGRVEYAPCPSVAAEAELIVKRIEELIGGVGSFSIYSGRGGESGGNTAFEDIAVLCRLSRQGAAIVSALDRRGLPVQLVGITPFFDRGELRPLYRLIKWAADPDDQASLAVALAGLAGVGKKTVDEIIALKEQPESDRGIEAMIRIKKLRRAWINQHGWTNFEASATTKDENSPNPRHFVGDFRINSAGNDPATAIKKLLHAYGLVENNDNCRRLINLAATFTDNRAMLKHMESLESRTIYDPRANGIAVMTIHAAKGLEFQSVFIPGLDQSVIPWAGNDDIEEERRLLYVAMTRATTNLILSGNSATPSPLIKEIPSQLMQRRKIKKRPKKKNPQMKLFQNPPSV